MDLKANTAVDILIGPFVDDTDGNTDETGLTISQADVRLSKNGQNMAQKNDSNACTHDELGYYNCPLDTTDTNTEGNLVVVVHESGALPVRHEYNVLSEAAWDSLYGAKDTGYMDVNIKAVSEDTTAADNLELACDNYSATRGLSGTALPAAAADAAGGLPISDAGALDLDTQLANTNEITAARMGALTDWINGGRLDLILDSIQVDVAGLDGDAMRGTDSAALASVCTEGRLAELDAANLPADIDNILTDTGTTIPGQITGLNDFDPANDTVARVTLTDTTTTNTDMRGTDSANTTVPDAAGTAASLIGSLNDFDPANDTVALVTDITTKTGYSLSSAGIDSIFDEVTENSISLREAVNLFLAALTGITSGGGSNTLTFRDTADSKNRLVVTVDANNNRTAVGTRDGS